MRFQVIFKWNFDGNQIGISVGRVPDDMPEYLKEVHDRDPDVPIRDRSLQVEYEHIAVIEAKDADAAYRAIMNATADS